MSSDDEDARDEALRDVIFKVLASCYLPVAPIQLLAELRKRVRLCASSSEHQLSQEDVATLDDADLLRCCRLLEETSGSVIRSWHGCFFLVVRETEMIRNALVSADYQALGMTVLRTGPEPYKTHVYVPSDAEHRFLEARESTIPNAGYGLFLKPTRSVRQGTLLCEYRGRALHSPPRDVALCPYMVEAATADSSGKRYIDGVDEEANLLCLAALINDNGLDGANVEFVECASHPGRVFVSAVRDIKPGSELFVCYGQSYWEERERESKRPIAKMAKRHRSELPQFHRCRRCTTMIPCRLSRLHSTFCGDPLAHHKVSELDSLPRNELTMFDDQLSLRQKFRVDLKMLPKRCLTFVAPDDSATFANSHVDVVSYLKIEVIEDGGDEHHPHVV